ncbi:poly-gamma-glutamate hydrolase family protein [Streptomyces sp. NRRL F-5727]|uniref:poly-gamma-glutamate hydrolase family protein n=1 Tax=Streptomyces sp. NRRL F-5727 TaxID=1463871 RepID=UPI0004C7A693|nr:poly-gamma-glutamate hydrolase family protein [Streptomyces sp. NRRL F-5727]
MTSSDHTASRRTVLTAFAAAAAAGAPLIGQLAAATPAAAFDPNSTTEYPSNTALYKDPDLVEGNQYGRRWRRHDRFDVKLSEKSDYARTAILALHGGGIEKGTSELALGIAGYDPGDLVGADNLPAPAILPTTYDYFLFEGLLSEGNKALHVTSKNCDDHIALSLARSHFNVLSLHGCTFDQIKLPTSEFPTTGNRAVAVVGGLNPAFRAALVTEIKNAGFQAVDAYNSKYSSTLGEFNGSHVTNPCNLTMLGMGAQLELTGELRASLFGDYDSRSGRATTWNQSGGRFEAFRDACRRAVATVEATQPIL